MTAILSPHAEELADELLARRLTEEQKRHLLEQELEEREICSEEYNRLIHLLHDPRSSPITV